MQYDSTLVVFRRDLRLEDNTALNEALEHSERVSCVFILDPRQADPQRNPYFSANAFAFMVESLIEIDEELQSRGARFAVFEGRADEVIAQLLEAHCFDALFVNRDVTPFSEARDGAIAAVCEGAGCAFHSCDDVMLNPPGSILTSGDPYRVFTPYWKRAREIPIREPRTSVGAFFSLEALRPRAIPVPTAGPDRSIRGGRRNALRILETLDSLAEYAKQRDIPSEHSTSRLSAHLKFGTISIREAITASRRSFGEDHELERQLYWRDFYHQILFHNPGVLGREFDPSYSGGIAWSEPGERFEAWKHGRTGFPIVDAGMRELLATGWMHNRVRMITASFLTKDLHIDWREGERYFAQHLVDYDPANNNGGWQWASSTGADAAPYFRIFNPWLQQKKFDPDAVYIKRWVPELSDLDANTIHALETRRPDGLAYPEPIVDHGVERAEALARYRAAKHNG
ncbi:MAG: cryptochrome/photolyase family protein [Candidatus Woesearchaeota archaeon]